MNGYFCFLSQGLISSKRMRVLGLSAGFFFLCFFSVGETKSYKVILGYESQEMEIYLSPGRVVPPHSEMPLPSSAQLNSAFPSPKSVQTVVPGTNPTPNANLPEGIPYEFPKMAGFEFPPGFFDTLTPQSIEAALNSTGRKILSGVTFEFDSFDLTPSSEPALEAVLGYLQSNPGVRIIIEGHCDTSGDTSLNPALSQNRANSVKAWLESRGADGSLLTAIGRSDSIPIADNGTPEGQALNRRVELVKE
jgi:outer membrane protein OmpA-like peptidoglycan-associated protein